MVDPIGAKPVLPVDRRTSAAVEPVARPAQTAQAAAMSDSSALVQTAKDFARQAPVDAERVARIRKAIADGTFPIAPSTIADRLIALKLQWNPND